MYHVFTIPLESWLDKTIPLDTKLEATIVLSCKRFIYCLPVYDSFFYFNGKNEKCHTINIYFKAGYISTDSWKITFCSLSNKISATYTCNLQHKTNTLFNVNMKLFVHFFCLNAWIEFWNVFVQFCFDRRSSGGEQTLMSQKLRDISVVVIFQSNESRGATHLLFCTEEPPLITLSYDNQFSFPPVLYKFVKTTHCLFLLLF